MRKKDDDRKAYEPGLLDVTDPGLHQQGALPRASLERGLVCNRVPLGLL